jgi:hypothetical protein
MKKVQQVDDLSEIASIKNKQSKIENTITELHTTFTTQMANLTNIILSYSSTSNHNFQ